MANETNATAPVTDTTKEVVKDNRGSVKQTNTTKPKKPKRHRIKDTISELKKVSWPGIGKVMKQTGTVLVVTVFFMAVIMLMDWLLGEGHKALIGGLGETKSVLTNLSSFIAEIGSNISSTLSTFSARLPLFM